LKEAFQKALLVLGFVDKNLTSSLWLYWTNGSVWFSTKTFK